MIDVELLEINRARVAQTLGIDLSVEDPLADQFRDGLQTSVPAQRPRHR